LAGGNLHVFRRVPDELLTILGLTTYEARAVPIFMIRLTLLLFIWMLGLHGSPPHPPPLFLECVATYTDSTAAHTVEPVTIASGEVELHGSVYRPSGTGPFPTVVLMHGGGNNLVQLRNTPEFFAPRLAACGIAALVYDKRGTGKSGGDYSSSTFDDFIEDAGRAAEALAAKSYTDAARIGIVGFSQGGRLAPVVAVRYPAVRFAASVSGPLTSVEDTRLYALEHSFRRAGVADSTIARVMPLWRDHLDAVAAADSEALARVDVGREPLVGTVHPALLPPPSGELPRTGIYNSMGRDYTAELGRLDVPWLALYGGEDGVVPVQESVKILEERMERAGNSQVRVHVEPGVGHSFVDPDTGERYRFEEAIIEWIVDITDSGGAACCAR
jgi:pimeloyl-ACP methyl ester carboxylesterase